MGIRDPNYLINVNYNELVPKVKEFLKTMTPHNARLELVKAGYSEKNVDNALGEAMKKSRVNLNKNANIILFKDFFDKIGYGFSSPMLMFILLYTINSSILFIGIYQG